MKSRCTLYLVTLAAMACFSAPYTALAEGAESIAIQSADLAGYAAGLHDAMNRAAGEESGRRQQIVPTGTPVGQFVPFLGREIDTVTIIEDNQRVEKFWVSLTPAQWKQALQDQFIQTLVYDAKSSAGLKALPGAASLGKGEFYLAYHNFRYKSYPCSSTNRAAGELLVGVGLRININAKFKSGSFSIGLAQLALSASRSKVSGSVEANVVGLANSSTLSQVVGAATGALTYNSLVEASKAYAVAGQALEDIISLSNPRIIGYRDGTIAGSCLAAMAGSTTP